MQQITKGRSKGSEPKQAPGKFADPASIGEKVNGAGAHGPLQSGDREKRIAIVAYYKAEQRGFQAGHELEDWLAAEREFDGAYLARTIGQYSDEP